MEPASRPAPRAVSGWLVGIVCGVFVGLWAFPTVRYTLASQFQLALAEDSVAWVRALDVQRSEAERPRLDSAAAAHSDDYLMQVGRATALIETNVPTNRHASADDDIPDDNDHTLLRLGFIARDFATVPGAYAHLARYMMVERVRIQRIEPDTASTSPDRSRANLPAAHSITPRRKDFRIIEWALRSGESLDPDNAFWPALLAATYFAAQRDAEGLEALTRAGRAKRWDAYIYEEVLGQWRLYSVAYGDNGATQKIAPLSLIAFPHLRELRRMAELARWRAEQAAAEGRDRDAIRIRRDLTRLGITMRDTAQWAYEALFGTDLFLIANTDAGANLTQTAIRGVPQWEAQASRYLQLLQTTDRAGWIAYLRQEVEASCALRQRVDIARFDSSYPGTPPGIPLVPLFGNWMAGILLIQQTVALCLAALLASLWHRRLVGDRPLPLRTRAAALFLLLLFTLTTGLFLLYGVPSRHVAMAFFVGLTVLLLLGLNGASQWRQRRKETPTESENKVEARWKSGTTVGLLALLLLPGLTALYLLRPALSGLHPVAVLLTSLMGNVQVLTPRDMLIRALLAGALPLAVVLCAALWALSRRVSPLLAALIGLRRFALPAVACLAVAYLLLLNRTLLLDAAASRAIDGAARNDLQWVLTHSEPHTGE